MFDGKGLVPVYVMEDIAKAIRSKMKEQNLYKPTEMAAAIRSMTPYFYDTTGTFYILSPDYWTIHVNQSEHQTISYNASGEAVRKGVDKWASRLFINSRIEANEGFTPGTIHKTIDSTNHDIVLMAEPAKAIADMVADGVLLVYCNSKDNMRYYSKMYWKRDETTGKDVLTFDGKIDAGNIDIPVRVVGADAGLVDFTNSGFSYSKSVKGFENDITLTWKTDALSNAFQGDDIVGDQNYQMEYIRMPNLTHFERRAGLCVDMPSVKSVNFENLEFINTELHAKGDSREISFCSIIHPYAGKPFQLTDVNFTQLKMAYCNLLQHCGATRLGLPNLEIVMRFTDFPYLEDISLPKLTECQADLLCNSPKLKVAKLPMLEKCGGRLLYNDTSLEEIDLPKFTVIPAYFLDAINPSTTGSYLSPNLKSINMPSAITAKGSFLNKQTSPNLTAVSLPKLQSIGGDSFYEDTALQKIDLPELITAGGTFLCNCNSLTAVSLPKLQSTGGNFVRFNDINTVLKELNVPKLEETGNFIYNAFGLTALSFPSLKKVNGTLLDSTKAQPTEISSIDAPKLETVTGNLINIKTEIESLNLPSLKSVGGNFLSEDSSRQQSKLKTINVPNLESIGGKCYVNNYSNSYLTRLSFPNLKTIGGSLASNSGYLEYIECPLLEKVGGDISYMTSFNNKSFALKEFVAPRLKTVGGLFITGPHNSLKRVEAPQLESIGRDALDNSALETVDFPLLKSVGGGLFNGSRSLNSVNLPSLETVGGMLFNGNAIKMLILPKLTTVEGGFCYSQSKLVYVDLGALELVSGAFIYDSPNIKTLIIRTETVPSIGGSICNKKPSDCILYVPDGMIEKYLANSKWSAAFDKDHIKSISEAPQPPA